MKNIYNIQSQLNNLFDDEPTVQQKIENQFNQVKKQIFSKQQDVKINNQEQHRSHSFWGKVEQQWENLKGRSKSPISQIERNEFNQVEEKKKIFQNIQVSKRTKPMIFSKPEWGRTSMQLVREPIQIQQNTEPEQDTSNNSITINESFQILLDNQIEQMYFKEDNEAIILSTLIERLGRQASLEKQGLLLENLSKKNDQAKKQLSLKLIENQQSLQHCYHLQDALTFRVNQCCARIGQARKVLTLLKGTHRDLGIRIQKKQQIKAQKEQELANAIKFRKRYTQVFELISQLSKEENVIHGWPLYKVISMKDLVWTQTRDPKQQMSLYICFNDIRGYLETLFQSQLDYSYRFFSQNIILQIYNQENDISIIIDNMCDYLQYYELSNKSIDFSKQIRTSIQAQFRSILRQNLENLPQVSKQHRRKIKFEGLGNLNKYLTSFLKSFYLTSYSLGLIVQQFQKLLQKTNQQNKQALLKKIGFQYNIEKNQFWQYIQDKIGKSLKHTKLDLGCNYFDWITFDMLCLKIIQIGEELSNLKSETIIFHLKKCLHLITQGIGAGLIKCFSVQKGTGQINQIKTNYQCIILNKLDIYMQTRRINIQSNYLIKYINMNELISQQQENDNVIHSTEGIYNKKEEYYFIISQFQELMFFGQYVPSQYIDCFLQTIFCFEFYAYLLIKNDLQQQIKDLLQEQQEIETFEDLVQAHDHFCQYKRYSDLKQIILKQIDNVISSEINIIVNYQSNSLQQINENLILLQQIFQFICKQYNNDDLIILQLKKCQQWIDQLIHFWIYNQGLKEAFVDKNFQSYQIMYKMTQIMNKVYQQQQPEIIGPIYFQAYINNLIQYLVEIINKENKLQIQAELQKFIKQISNQNKSQQLELFINLLDLKNQNKVKEKILQSKDLSLKIQIELLEKEFIIEKKQLFEPYRQYLYNYL